jgi:hypothetical protein
MSRKTRKPTLKQRVKAVEAECKRLSDLLVIALGRPIPILTLPVPGRYDVPPWLQKPYVVAYGCQPYMTTGGVITPNTGWYLQDNINTTQFES